MDSYDQLLGAGDIHFLLSFMLILHVNCDAGIIKVLVLLIYEAGLLL